MKAELVLDLKMNLGEGPFWDTRENTLHWVDINEQKFYSWKPGKGEPDYIKLDQKIGTAVPRMQGGNIAALKDGFYSIESDGSVKPFAAVEGEPEQNRFNDGKCDPAGRLLAGTLSLKGEKHQASLYQLEENGNISRMLQGLSISNGMAWNREGNILYFIDTPENKVFAFDYDLDSGAISNQRTVIDIPDGEGSPDGMTIDTDGNLWIAHWGGWQVACWDPHSGKKLESIRVPASRVTCCTFGGEGLDELYITTASEGLPENELEREPKAGGLFIAKPGVKGFAPFAFKG